MRQFCYLDILPRKFVEFLRRITSECEFGDPANAPVPFCFYGFSSAGYSGRDCGRYGNWRAVSHLGRKRREVVTMPSIKQTYLDRFGHEWSMRVARKRGKPGSVTFTCGDLVLVADDDDPADLTSARLKDLFCDAERVLKHRKEKWYVGFRQRMGRGGRAQAGMHTRFRSESGEVRYSRGILHFRHMPETALLDHLGNAERARKPTA